MLSAETAISRFRRDVTLGTLLRSLLLIAALGAMGLNIVHAMKLDGTLLLIGVGALWVVLSYRSVKGTRLAAESPSIIASGDLEAAEEQVELALRSFSLFRSAKLLSLHHLALLRHAQRRWRDSAMLCRTLLNQRLGSMRSISKPSRLLLADALLEMGNVREAYIVISELYRERMSLGESMSLLLVQLEYESKIGAWQAMLPRGGSYKRLELAELMPATNAARAQALMALAARRLGREDWSAWLRLRAELLADPAQLVADRPILSELWPTRPPIERQITGIDRTVSS
jgi:hypothetical protein